MESTGKLARLRAWGYPKPRAAGLAGLLLVGLVLLVNWVFLSPIGAHEVAGDWMCQGDPLPRTDGALARSSTRRWWLRFDLAGRNSGLASSSISAAGPTRMQCFETGLTGITFRELHMTAYREFERCGSRTGMVKARVKEGRLSFPETGIECERGSALRELERSRDQLRDYIWELNRRQRHR